MTYRCVNVQMGHMICCTDGQVVMDHLMDWQRWCTDGQTLTDGLTDCVHDIQMCQQMDGTHDVWTWQWMDWLHDIWMD